jgi:arginine utilization protein RocB
LQTLFFVPEADTFDQTLRQLDKELGRTIKKVKTTEKDTSDTLNGMRHFSTGGTGEVDGSAIEWGVDILEAKKPAIVLFFAAPGAFDDHGKEVDQFIESIKRMPAAARSGAERSCAYPR